MWLCSVTAIDFICHYNMRVDVGFCRIFAVIALTGRNSSQLRKHFHYRLDWSRETSIRKWTLWQPLRTCQAVNLELWSEWSISIVGCTRWPEPPISHSRNITTYVSKCLGGGTSNGLNFEFKFDVYRDKFFWTITQISFVPSALKEFPIRLMLFSLKCMYNICSYVHCIVLFHKFHSGLANIIIL